MFRHLNRIKGQSTMEYAVLIIIIIGALLSINIYIRRGVMGRLKSATDDIGDQFSPGNTNVIYHTSVNSSSAELFGIDKDGLAAQGVSSSVLQADEKTITNIQSNIINVEFEYNGK